MINTNTPYHENQIKQYFWHVLFGQALQSLFDFTLDSWTVILATAGASLSPSGGG